MVDVGWRDEVLGVQLSICLPAAYRKRKRNELHRFIMKIGLNVKTSFNSQQAAAVFLKRFALGEGS